MAQVKYQGNLSAAAFPLATIFKGPSVIIPNRDQNSGPYRDFSGATTQLGMNIPQLYYAENVIPTNEGYKSIAYNPFIGAAVGATGTFQTVLTIFDGNSNKALLGVTSTFEIWMLSQYTAGAWSKITLPGGAVWSTGIITQGNVYGVQYINLQGLGIYIVDIPTTVFTKATVVGATDTDFIGIVDSTSYLIGYDEISIIWSSTEDPLDFTPSLITGAGGGTPDSLKGQIIFCKEISKGFIIYTSVMIIAATYSGNLQYPWVFFPLANGSGIASYEDVVEQSDTGSQAAWTAAGLLEVNTQYCTPKYAEVTDFLAAGVWETFSSETKLVSVEYTSVPYRVKLASIANRYFCISYGQVFSETSPFTYILLYDILLKRWGKAKITHTHVFEIVSDTSGLGLTWTASAPNTWSQYPVAWSSLVKFGNTPAHAKNTLGILTESGAIQYVDFTYGDAGAPGVAIFGKFQLTRTTLSTLEEIELETLQEDNLNFSCSVQSIDDRGNSIVSPAVLITNNGTYRRYDTHVTGISHSAVFEGAFSLCSHIYTLHQNGRR